MPKTSEKTATFSNLEFHRSGIGLLPNPHEPDPGLAVHLAGVAGSQRPLTFCSCSAGRRSNCKHLRELGKQIKSFQRHHDGRSWSDLFASSAWLALAQLLHRDVGAAADAVEVLAERHDGVLWLTVEGVTLVRYHDPSPARIRLLERLGKTPKGGGFADRDGLLQRLGTFLRSPEEQHLNKAGMRTNRQSFEESLVWRLAYHCYREFEGAALLQPSIDRRTGDFCIEVRRQTEAASPSGGGTRKRSATGSGGNGDADISQATRSSPDGELLLQIVVPRPRVVDVLRFFGTPDPPGDGEAEAASRRGEPAPAVANNGGPPAAMAQVGGGEEAEATEVPGGVELAEPIQPLLSSTLFHVGPETHVDPAQREAVMLLVAHGEDTLDEPERERFRYGDLVFVEELGVLVQVDRRPDAWQLPDPEELVLDPARIGTFESQSAPSGEEAVLKLEDPMSELGIFTEFDYMEVRPDENADEMAMEIRYGFGDEEVSLPDLLRAKQAGQTYYQTAAGWIDLNSPSMRALASLLRQKKLDERVAVRRGGGNGDSAEKLRLSSAELLRLRASSPKPIRVDGVGDRSAFLQRFLDLQPVGDLVVPKGLKSELRPYQKLGLEWLKFLFENRLAGLLCDDMGLGKTHQAMALMVLVREQFGIEEPFMVVSPRTVISHWRNKVRDHAPGLRAVQYHGPQRDLDKALEEGDVLLTSYGVLRNDVERFSENAWGLVIFDEVQQIKNRATQGYQAAASLPGRMKLGLTGTPIENSLTELKALFDLILPGYLGSEDDFRDRYGANADMEQDSYHLASLRRLTAPFVLRRVKTAVLDELPEKIEDVRTCSLSPEQLQLYRSTIATKGVSLMKKLQTGSDPLPYIHIFALLNMLKQICDHPALALGQLDTWRDYESGKWDLFLELLSESLDSGQKVVVFTQYLGMIRIIGEQLQEMGVPYVTLTGASRKRGDIVDRFNEDPDCRVFLGSLKAGGTGIDLVGGSVVIHYDRWWNAAREDQATDRLYRIGQKRVVQVFKLVTENTLEERIAMIIDHKRRLMSSVVQEDDPKLQKIFTREELIELLRDPDE
ncbi:MAG: ATP-dependent helicase [Acidobacteria bacterium]|nr:MAG: ATP-dependent helicase [Acidobacteriota bacterium]REK09245.1 MAG: ATP-dependent helicase [Acidobacteriota bacterium]